MSTSKTHKANTETTHKAKRTGITQTVKSHKFLQKSGMIQASHFYAPAVAKFVMRKQERVVNLHNIVLFRVDTDLDQISLQDNLSPKAQEAKKMFASYRKMK